MIGIYARISQEDQSQYSISDQLRECKLKAGTNDLIEYVDEGFSGEYLDRPALTRLRNDVREGIITRVICYDPDRWSRKLVNQLIVTEEIEKHATLEFVNHQYAKTPEGMLFYQMRGAFSEFEKAKINERMSRGRRQKARKGKIVRDFQVYGYSYDHDTELMVVNEVEAAIIRLIFDLITVPNDLVKGINGIAKYLTEKGVPTKRDVGVWHRQVVRQILMNQVYTGTFYQNKWNTEGMLGNKHKKDEDKISMKLRPEEEWIPVGCPVLIEEGQFNRAQILIAEGRRRWAKNGIHEYLLSGIVRCGECGNTMTGRRSVNWNVPTFEYSDVKNYSGAKFKGCGLKVSCEKLDNEVWHTIQGWIDNPAEVAAAKEDGVTFSEGTGELDRLGVEIEKTRVGRRRLLNLLVDSEDISESEVREKLKDLKRKEDEILKQIDEAQKRSVAPDSSYHQRAMQEALAYYLNRIDELTDDDRKHLIRHVVKEVIVYNDRSEIIQF